MNESQLAILRLRLANYLGCHYSEIDEATWHEFLAEYSKRNG
jgi:hypothetical protein